MRDLAELREEIDGIDRELVRLFEQRMSISREVADYKIETGKKVFDREREISKLNTLGGLASNEFNKKGIRELFEQIMSMSRKLQYQLLAKRGVLGKMPFIEVEALETKNARVAFQGIEGSHGQEAMYKYFGKDINSCHVDSFREAMEVIEEGSADFAVLPIENSTAGSVGEVYDLLVEFENYIVAEQIIKIDHALLGLPGSSLEDICTVCSHPQALMQGARFLDSHPDWQRISVSNTAMAARKLLEDGDRSKAALASEYAAKVYGLDILEPHTDLSKDNSTRFLIVTNQKIFRRDARKISICFELPHESGSLYHILSHFIYNDLNMTKIESHPISERSWEYRFFIDFEGNMADGAVKNALRGLREEAANLKILGNY